CRIFSTLTPRPTSISYCVTVGPRENPVTLASTLNCSSTLVICAMVRSVASERVTGGGPALSTPGDGSTYGAAGGCSAFGPGPDVPNPSSPGSSPVDPSSSSSAVAFCSPSTSASALMSVSTSVAASWAASTMT